MGGLFLVFAAGLSAWLRQSEPAPRPLSAVFGSAAIGLAVLILAGFVPIAVAAYRTYAPSLSGTLADLTLGLLACRSRAP